MTGDEISAAELLLDGAIRDGIPLRGQLPCLDALASLVDAAWKYRAATAEKRAIQPGSLQAEWLEAGRLGERERCAALADALADKCKAEAEMEWDRSTTDHAIGGFDACRDLSEKIRQGASIAPQVKEAAQ